MADIIQIRRDTAAVWTLVNPVLYDGEWGLEIDSDPKKLKIGNGTTAWNDLAYFVFDTSIDLSIEFIMDGGDTILTPGIKGDLEIPFNCIIKSVKLFSEQTGSIVVDIWKANYAGYPPTVADTITASAKPTLSSAIKYSDITLTGWTKTITAGDVLRFNVDSVSLIQRINISLIISKT